MPEELHRVLIPRDGYKPEFTALAGGLEESLESRKNRKLLLKKELRSLLDEIDPSRTGRE